MRSPGQKESRIGTDEMGHFRAGIVCGNSSTMAERPSAPYNGGGWRHRCAAKVRRKWRRFRPRAEETQGNDGANGQQRKTEADGHSGRWVSSQYEGAPSSGAWVAGDLRNSGRVEDDGCTRSDEHPAGVAVSGCVARHSL